MCCEALLAVKSKYQVHYHPKEEREAGKAGRASQAEIQEMSHSATHFLSDLGHDISSPK